MIDRDLTDMSETDMERNFDGSVGLKWIVKPTKMKIYIYIYKCTLFFVSSISI